MALTIETSPRTAPRAAAGPMVLEQNGVLRLTGAVPSIADWRRACDAAVRTVTPVALADLVEVNGRPAQHADRAIAVAAAIGHALQKAHADAGVLVEADDGAVTLWGRAATRRDKAVAGIAAGSVPGVGYVQNWIRVER